jgi:hypothetical protein
MATHTQPYVENRVLYEDVWDPSVMTHFQPDLKMDDSHCPILGAQQGFTRAPSLARDTAFVFPCWQVDLHQRDLHGHYLSAHNLVLPEVCDFPLGMRWPIDIGYNVFKRSIQGALGAAGAVFQKILHSMNEQLQRWFTIVEIDVARFLIPSCPFLLFPEVLS